MIMNRIEREQAQRMVNIAWREFADKVDLPSREPSEDMRLMLMYLVWIATDTERAAQEAVRKLALAEEREACAKIADDQVQTVSGSLGIRGVDERGMAALNIAREIRARSEEKEVKK